MKKEIKILKNWYYDTNGNESEGELPIPDLILEIALNCNF